MRNINPMADDISSTSTINHVTTAPLLSIFKDTSVVLNKLGREFISEQNRIRELESRLNPARFHLTVFGQFKRGKSTLLNALIDEELLSSAIVPQYGVTLATSNSKHGRILTIRSADFLEARTSS